MPTARSKAVTVNGSFTIRNITFYNGTGQPGFQLNGGTLALTGGINSATTRSVIASTLSLSNFNFFNTNDAAGSLEFTGTVQGNASIVKGGGGTLALTGTNTFVGDVSITNGTLAIGSNAGLGAAANKLFMIQGTTLRLLGNVSGRRQVFLAGGPDDVILDTNGHRGSLTLLSSERTPTRAPGGNEGKGQAGPFNARKTGAGTLILVGDSSIDRFTAEAGLTRLDGTLTTTDLTRIEAGAIFGGTGTVTGRFENAGTVSPGNSPGALNIAGDYVQQSGATLRIEIAGRAAGQFDLLAVGGGAQLNGAARFITLNNFVPAGGDRFTFLTATGGVSGTFSTVNLDAPLLGGSVEYAANSTTLVITRRPIINPPPVVIVDPGPKPPVVVGPPVIFALTPNQAAVAHVLDDNINDSRLRKVFAPIDRLRADDIPAALDLLAPEELSAIFEIGIGSANVQAFNLDRHLSEMRAGRTGFSASHFNMAVPDGKIAIAPDGKTGGKDIFDPSPENRWSVFIAGSGQWIDLDTDFNAPGYEITTGGLTLGADYRLSETFAIGLLTGYARSTADLTGDAHIRVNSGKLGLYASWFDQGCHLTGLVSGGYNDYEIKRHGLGGKPHGDTDGGEFNALLSAGHDFKAGAVTVGPIVEGQFTHVGYDGFRERGSVAPLDIESNDSDSLRTRVGARAAVHFRIGKIEVRPEARIAWEHEYLDQTRLTDSHFASGVGSTFRVEGPDHGRDSVLVNASITLLSGERASVFIAYDGLLGRDSYTSHSVSGGFQWSF